MVALNNGEAAIIGDSIGAVLWLFFGKNVTKHGPWQLDQSWSVLLTEAGRENWSILWGRGQVVAVKSHRVHQEWQRQGVQRVYGNLVVVWIPMIDHRLLALLLTIYQPLLTGHCTVLMILLQCYCNWLSMAFEIDCQWPWIVIDCQWLWIVTDCQLNMLIT